MQAAIWRYLVVMYCLSHLPIPPLSFSLYVCVCVRMSVIIIIEKYIWHLMAWTKLSAFKIKSKSARLRRYLHVQEPLEFDATQKPISSLSPTNLLISLPFFLIFLPPLLSLSKQIPPFFLSGARWANSNAKCAENRPNSFARHAGRFFTVQETARNKTGKPIRLNVNPLLLRHIQSMGG